MFGKANSEEEGVSRDRHDPEARARAEARFRKVEAQATEGAKAKAEHDVRIAARDANTARLKALRLEKEQAGKPKPRSTP